MITCVILWLITNPTAFSSKLYDDLLRFVTTQLLLSTFSFFVALVLLFTAIRKIRRWSKLSVKKETQHGIFKLFPNPKNNPRDRGSGKEKFGGDLMVFKITEGRKAC